VFAWPKPRIPSRAWFELPKSPPCWAPHLQRKGESFTHHWSFQHYQRILTIWNLSPTQLLYWNLINEKRVMNIVNQTADLGTFPWYLTFQWSNSTSTWPRWRAKNTTRLLHTEH
jgi:hypothetical protein